MGQPPPLFHLFSFFLKHFTQNKTFDFKGRLFVLSEKTESVLTTTTTMAHVFKIRINSVSWLKYILKPVTVVDSL